VKLTVLIAPATEARLREAAAWREEALTTWVREAIRQRLDRVESAVQSQNQGVITLREGTALVPTIRVTASSRIALEPLVINNRPRLVAMEVLPGVSFTIRSVGGTGHERVAWQIFEPPEATGG
jgi:hypothetical protein